MGKIISKRGQKKVQEKLQDVGVDSIYIYTSTSVEIYEMTQEEKDTIEKVFNDIRKQLDAIGKDSDA